MTPPEPVVLARPALFDTGAWTWVRDRRFPTLAPWFNAEVRAGRVLMADPVALELIRLAPNEARARGTAARLAALHRLAMPADAWSDARALQLALSGNGDHRRVPPIGLLIATVALAADVPLVHYDRDYVRIAGVSALDHRWLVPDGALA